MKKTLTIVLTLLLSLSSFACMCDWGGDFFTMSKQTDVVAKVCVTKKIKGYKGFNMKMEAEIIEIFKGQEKRKTITIWGDDGKECRPYIDYFELGEVYYLSLFKYNNEYEQANCGEMYLKVEGDKVIPQKGVSKELSQVGEMTTQEFETQLKTNLK